MAQSTCRSARSSSVDIRSLISSFPVSAWARVNIAISVATWSLRERAVWSLPPTGPSSSVSRRSIAIWMSSSSTWTSNVSSSISFRTAASPRSSETRSSAPMMPRLASIRACAIDWARSYGASR